MSVPVLIRSIDPARERCSCLTNPLQISAGIRELQNRRPACLPSARSSHFSPPSEQSRQYSIIPLCASRVCCWRHVCVAIYMRDAAEWHGCAVNYGPLCTHSVPPSSPRTQERPVLCTQTAKTAVYFAAFSSAHRLVCARVCDREVVEHNIQSY